MRCPCLCGRTPALNGPGHSASWAMQAGAGQAPPPSCARGLPPPHAYLERRSDLRRANVWYITLTRPPAQTRRQKPLTARERTAAMTGHQPARRRPAGSGDGESAHMEGTLRLCMGRRHRFV